MQEILNSLISKFVDIGVQLILPFFMSILLVVGFFKLRSLAVAGVHPSLIYIAYSLLFYALHFIVPVLVSSLLIFIGGDSLENYVELAINTIAFLFIFSGTLLLFRAVSLI